MNRLVKAKDDSNYGKKATGLPPAIERIRTEIRRQHEEQFLAVIDRGEYKSTDEFSHLGVEEKDFFRMSDPQKNALKRSSFLLRCPMLEVISHHMKRRIEPRDTVCLYLLREPK